MTFASIGRGSCVALERRNRWPSSSRLSCTPGWRPSMLPDPASVLRPSSNYNRDENIACTAEPANAVATWPFFSYCLAGVALSVHQSMARGNGPSARVEAVRLPNGSASADFVVLRVYAVPTDSVSQQAKACRVRKIAHGSPQSLPSGGRLCFCLA